MILLYDLIASQSNSDGKYHGGGKYAKIIFLELVKYSSALTAEVRVYALFDSKKYLEENVSAIANLHGIELIDIRNHDSIANIVDRYRVTRFYSALPYYIAGVDKLGCDVIGTIHGLRELETPITLNSLLYFNSLRDKLKMAAKWFFSGYLKTRKKEHFKRLLESIKVITVSNHTKYSIMAYYPAIKDKLINVFYSPDVSNDYKGLKTDFSLSEANYFLMVSGNRWIKNNLRAAIALDQLFSERAEIINKVIITGVSNQHLFLKKLKNKDRFIFFNYVDEDVLNYLYKNAYALIYMSLNEGFGYPPLEAMRYRVPVIASPFTSISEICGNSVLYSNPLAIDEIKNRVLQLLHQSTYIHFQSEGEKRYEHVKSIQERDLKNLINYLLQKQ